MLLAGPGKLDYVYPMCLVLNAGLSTRKTPIKTHNFGQLLDNTSVPGFFCKHFIYKLLNLFLTGEVELRYREYPGVLTRADRLVTVITAVLVSDQLQLLSEEFF